MAFNSEQALWNAVILQAVRDALEQSPCPSGQRAILRDQARAWLTRPNEDFSRACEYAGLEPEEVRSHAKRLIAEADRNPKERKPRGPAQVLQCEGLRMTIAQWAARKRISEFSLRSRLRLGWPVEKALNTPAGARTRGVVKDFQETSGTGGGSAAQHSPEIEFFSPKEAESCL